jgi:hypothetical protein
VVKNSKTFSQRKPLYQKNIMILHSTTLHTYDTPPSASSCAPHPGRKSGREQDEKPEKKSKGKHYEETVQKKAEGLQTVKRILKEKLTSLRGESIKC